MTLLLGLCLCALAAVPGGTVVVADARPGAYAFAPGARTIAGAAGSVDAERLDPGRVYRSSLPGHGRLYYRLRLPATASAYVPVTAVPPASATVSATDGIRVSVQDANGTACSYASARFGAGLSPRPVTALAQREAGNALCQGAGTYYLLVERLEAEGSGAVASAEGWDLEIAPVTEPRTAHALPTTAPDAWDSTTPEPVTAEPRDRSGGAGFASARPVGQGVWRTALVPGQTQFYKVPLDWGRQLHASVELGSSTGHGYVGGALNLSLYNPVRGYVDDASLGYTGTQKSAALGSLPPVAYANRYAVPTAVTSVRFAGEYYLVLHLSDHMTGTFGRGPFGVTLRIRVDGRAHAGPRYAGTPEPADVFTITKGDREEALTGTTAGGDGLVSKLVAVAGIGLGTLLLLVLGGWTVTARRAQTRASAQKPTA
ncbi:hypothetical protein LK07_16790 [Streptomyces pluripotens]|uniref:Uncharacterized protein n=1 Tax=Streptomyces pluripotens TaxID=1355015 RepID=A0A221NZH2_9ACTN|nr:MULTISPECIES: hypothetical protein [Streptomyces]ASN25413.1 hypothetical protein LK07_16790 [Streptomyces pluripotens]MCH0557056.1 hypothetical protein [Streptomyces sp. MUM 16J]